MKNLTLLSALFVLVLSCISCNGRVNKREIAQTVNTAKVTVYYFHFTRRCVTCLAVEENARKAVEALYPNEVKSGEYSFNSLNLDEANTKGIANKLGVGGQTLLVVHGENKVDITSAAWMSAHDPDKMKKEVRSGIEKVLF
jgi:hypothetical protein